jgi:hypothetical protein
LLFEASNAAFTTGVTAIPAAPATPFTAAVAAAVAALDVSVNVLLRVKNRKHPPQINPIVSARMVSIPAAEVKKFEVEG